AHRHRGDARDLLWQLQGVALGHQDQADARLPGAVQLFVNAAHGLDPPLDGDLTSDRDILPQGPLPKRADDGQDDGGACRRPIDAPAADDVDVYVPVVGGGRIDGPSAGAAVV